MRSCEWGTLPRRKRRRSAFNGRQTCGWSAPPVSAISDIRRTCPTHRAEPLAISRSAGLVSHLHSEPHSTGEVPMTERLAFLNKANSAYYHRGIPPVDEELA